MRLSERLCQCGALVVQKEAVNVREITKCASSSAPSVDLTLPQCFGAPWTAA